MLNIPIDKEINDNGEKESKCVVRLTTTAWSDKRGLHTKKSLTFLRKQCCRGVNLLEYEADNSSAGEAISLITNLANCKDGVYAVELYDKSRDWETGYIDSCDYKLVPILAPEGE